MIDYSTLEQTLEQTHSVIGAPEVHGLICGFICAGPRMNGKAWLDVVLGAIEPRSKDIETLRKVLIEIYMTSNKQLKNMDFDLNLLLPSDEQSLSARARAVGEWCDGVMAGLGLAGVDIESCESEDIREALFHVWEIAQVDYERLEFSDEDESAYARVVDYMHTTTYMLYNEFALQGTREVMKNTGVELVH